MDENTREWLAAEVERLGEIERADVRRHRRRALLILALLAAAFIVGWRVLSSLAERLMDFLFPFGIG